MKVRDSGMPEAALWTTFFDPCQIFDHLGLKEPAGLIVDFGSGYGTFLLAAAELFPLSQVIGLDIEEALNKGVVAAARSRGLANLAVRTRDFIADGSGLDDRTVDVVLAFNILHAEDPIGLLSEAKRILKPGGVVAVMHWNHDATTPRGPKMDIRPRPEQCLDWARQAGFDVPESAAPVARHHYGFIARKQQFQ